MDTRLVTICGKARSDRPIIYYIRPLLDLMSKTDKIIVWSWGYYREVLHALNVPSYELEPEAVVREFFDGNLWLTDPGSYFIDPLIIEAREPLLYACWLCKAYVLRKVFDVAPIDGAIWIDCAYRVSYRHNHLIDNYISGAPWKIDVERFRKKVAEWLEEAPLVIASAPIPRDLDTENAHELRPVTGCFLAVRRDYKDNMFALLRSVHHDLVLKRRLGTDEAAWALAFKDVAKTVHWTTWDEALYG
ncbi:MAG: hypothetical protein QXS54_08940 [Candidatus Methanomethylicaceae archaeon]